MSYERKRAPSHTAELPSKRMRNLSNQAVKTLANLSTVSSDMSVLTSTMSFGFDQENEYSIYFDNSVAVSTPFSGPFEQQRNGTSVTIPQRSSSRGPSSQDLSNRQYTGYQVLEQMLPSQPVLDSSPPGLDLCPSSPATEVLAAYCASELDTTIYEDPIVNSSIVMGDQLVPTGPPTPSNLNFQDLSLLDMPKIPLSTLPSRQVAYHNRASLLLVPSAVFARCFPIIFRNDIVISFDKGKQVIKVDRYLLCNASHFFAQMLHGPFLDSCTRCVRLRDDFPYAIKVMLQFINTGTYTFDPAMREQHHNITMLDLHIHAYLIGSKYAVLQLCAHAITHYTTLASLILSVRIPHAPSHPAAQAYASLLDSFVLLWKNTPAAHDTLRAAVLELIKPCLNSLVKLPYFVTLMTQMPAFGDDVVRSLAEDGFDVKAYAVPEEVEKRWGVMFGRVV